MGPDPKVGMASPGPAIWSDLPILIRLKRVIWRSCSCRGRNRPDLPVGCPAQFDWTFLRGIWVTRRKSPRQIKEFTAQVPAEKPLHTLRSARQVNAMLRVLPLRRIKDPKMPN